MPAPLAAMAAKGAGAGAKAGVAGAEKEQAGTLGADMSGFGDSPMSKNEAAMGTLDDLAGIFGDLSNHFNQPTQVRVPVPQPISRR